MSRALIEEQLMLVYDGEITFSRAASKTMHEWRKMAEVVIRRWRPPTYWNEEDVLQELLYHASVWMWKWDRDRSGAAGLARFTIWNALAEAKRATHDARGAILHGAAGKNPSRFERPFSSLISRSAEDDEDLSFVETLLRVEAQVEHVHIARDSRMHEVQDALEVCSTGKERAAILAMAEAGTIDGAVDVLYGHRGSRMAFNLADRQDAETMLVKTVETVSIKLEIARAIEKNF